jgi:hypothetical protein
MKYRSSESLQDGLEVEVNTKLSDRFTALNEPLVQTCSAVQLYSLDLMKAYLLTELKLRYKTEFNVKSSHDKYAHFEFKKIVYLLTIGAADILGDGTIGLRIAPVDQVTKSVISTRQRWDGSLTFNGIFCKIDISLKHFVEAAIDVIKRVNRATNGWLEQQLLELNRRSGNDALRAISSCFRREFGALADSMILYPYTAVQGRFIGQYAMGDSLFGELIDRIKRALATSIPRAQKIAAMMEGQLDIDLTESGKALASGSKLEVPNIEPRKYSYSSRALFEAEKDYFPEGPIVCHPLVFRDEVLNTQLIVCYPRRLLDMQGERIAHRVDSLKPSILDILKSHDSVAPILRLMGNSTIASSATRIKTELEIERELISPDIEARKALAELQGRLITLVAQLPSFIPAKDKAPYGPLIGALCTEIRACNDRKLLERYHDLLLKEGSTLSTLRKIKGMSS